jgi:hypothetical protein
MKKIFAFAFSLALGLSAVSAQTTKPATANQKVVTDGPVITFTSNKHDFGTIKEGDVVKHSFGGKCYLRLHHARLDQDSGCTW